MMNYLIYQQVSFDIMNNLVNSEIDPTILFLPEMNRFNMRIKYLPLPCPVISHSFMTMFNPTFHSIRPINFRTHYCQCSINVPVIEMLIGLLQDGFLF